MITKEKLETARKNGYNYYLRAIEENFPFPILWAKTLKQAKELEYIYNEQSNFHFEIIPF